LFGRRLSRAIPSRYSSPPPKSQRDSHIVITTIMFNNIASALMGYLLVNVRCAGQ